MAKENETNDDENPTGNTGTRSDDRGTEKKG